MPTYYKPNSLWWWHAGGGERVLVRVVQDYSNYISVRVQAITAEQVIKTGVDPYKLQYLDKRSAPLLEIKA